MPERSKSISQIAHDALLDITDGCFTSLPTIGITGLLNDLQYVWLKRLGVTVIDFEALDLARKLCNFENKAVFKMTGCGSVEEIRDTFQKYLSENHGKDDRVIVSLSYNKPKIDAEWVPVSEYRELIGKKDNPRG